MDFRKKQKEEQPEVFPPREDCFPRGFKEVYFEEMPGEIYMEFTLTSLYTKNCRCPECGSSRYQVRGSEMRRVIDLPYLGRVVGEGLRIPEFRCDDCGRESFVPDISDFVRSGSQMTNRLQEFVVFLEARTSGEGASRILECMDLFISGDTILRTAKRYEQDMDADIWRRAHRFRGKNEQKFDEFHAQELANSLAYYMEPQIVSDDREQRINAMEKLFDLVFTKRKRSPGVGEPKVVGRPKRDTWIFRWK